MATERPFDQDGIIGIRGNIDIERTIIYDEAFKEIGYNPAINFVSLCHNFKEDKKLEAESKSKGQPTYKRPDEVLQILKRITELEDAQIDLENILGGVDDEEFRENLEKNKVYLSYLRAFKREAEDFGKRSYHAEEGIHKKKEHIDKKYNKEKINLEKDYIKDLAESTMEKERELVLSEESKQKNVAYLRSETKRFANAAKKIVWTVLPSVLTGAALYYKFNIDWMISLATGIIMALPAGHLIYKREHFKEKNIIDDYEERRRGVIDDFEGRYNGIKSAYKKDKEELEEKCEREKTRADSDLNKSEDEILKEEYEHILREANVHIKGSVKLAYDEVNVDDLFSMLEKKEIL